MKNFLRYILVISISFFCNNNYAQVITTNGMSFSPDTLNVSVGDTVIFNLGSTHNAVEVDEATWLLSGTNSNGGFNFSFGSIGNLIIDSARTYYYVCQPHASSGMKGVIISEVINIDCNGIANGTSILDSCGVCQQAYIYDVVTHAVTLLNDTSNIALGPTEILVLPNDPQNPYWNSSCVTIPASNIFFSEYGEGSSNNKYLEIYNATNDTVDLTNYALARVNNSPNNNGVGVYEYWVDFDSAAYILPNQVFVVAHPSADSLILMHADMTYGSLSNGNDGFALVYGTEPTIAEPPGNTYIALDWIGTWEGDYINNPGSANDGWNVAGVSLATINHTLIRKCPVSSGDTSWYNAAGTTNSNSQWIVKPNDYWDDIGQHTYNITSYDSVSYSICNGLSITVGVNNYDSTGIYSDTLIATNGCDSIVTTLLTVLNSSASIVTNNYTICDGDSVVVSSNVYMSTGFFVDTLINNSGCDSIIYTNLTVQTPVYQEFSICDGDSVVVGNSTYYLSGNYSDTIQSSIGCDSIIYTTITVYNQFNPIKGGISDNSVGGGGFYSGSQYLELSCYLPSELVSAVVYSQDTVFATFEIRDANGNVLSDTSHQIIPGGQRVYFNYPLSSGIDYQLGINGASNNLYRNNSGVNYPYDFGNLASITSSSAGSNYYYFYYDVEIKQSLQPINYSICAGDSIQIGTSIYTLTGSYTDTLISAIGCDSIIYTNLTVNTNAAYTNNQTICSGENYTINGHIYDSTGTYFDTLQTQYGCDSVVTTNLLVLSIIGTGSTITRTICIGDTMLVGSSAYANTGTYFDTLTNSSGCDSVITTVLTVTSASYNSINGGIPDTVVGPGAYSSYNGQLNLSSTLPSLLKSATVYSADTNTVTFELRDSNGNLLQDITHLISPGMQVLNFNFFIPIGSDFQLGISSGGSGLYRSNVNDGGNWSYPFYLGPVTINSANTGTQDYYYFYYDIEIMPYATFNETNICLGDSLQVGLNYYSNPGTYVDTLDNTILCDSVVYTILDIYQTPNLFIDSDPDPAIICLGDTVVLEASSGFSTYFWNNGSSTQSVLDSPNADTWYLVEAEDSNGCIVREDIWVYVDSCISGFNNYAINNLLVYPNPATNYLNVIFESLANEKLGLRILNAVGEEVINESYLNFEGKYEKRFDLNYLSNGVYFIEITTENRVINRKIILQ